MTMEERISRERQLLDELPELADFDLSRAKHRLGYWVLKETPEIQYLVKFFDGRTAHEQIFERVRGYLLGIGWTVPERMATGTLRSGRYWNLCRVQNGISLRRWFSTASEAQAHAMGGRIAKLCRSFHRAELELPDVDAWGGDFQTDIDLLLYRYGLLKNKEPKEYLLVDHITQNRHLLNNYFKFNLFMILSLDSLFIGEGGEVIVKDLSHVRSGDSVYDLLFLNDVCDYSQPFLDGFLDAYYDGRRPVNIFRYLSLYTAVQMLKKLVEVSGGEVTYHDEKRAVDHFYDIISYFDEFTQAIPKWAKK